MPYALDDGATFILLDKKFADDNIVIFKGVSYPIVDGCDMLHEVSLPFVSVSSSCLISAPSGVTNLTYCIAGTPAFHANCMASHSPDAAPQIAYLPKRGKLAPHATQ